MERLKPESENVTKKRKKLWGQKKCSWGESEKKQVDWEIQGMSLQHLFPCGLLYSGFFRNAVSNPGRAIYKSKPCFAHFLSHSSSLERHTCLQMASVQMEFGWHVQTCFVSQTEPQTSLAFSNYFILFNPFSTVIGLTAASLCVHSLCVCMCI